MVVESKVVFGDVSDIWIELIEEAEERLIIFTPYFDDKLIEVIDSIEDPMTFETVTLVTNMDDKHIAQNTHQIRILKIISDKGVVIKGLSNLHAKVLVVDEKYMTIGSQNFTESGSRKNKEATIVLTLEMGDAHVQELSDMEKWLAESKIVPSEYIQELYELFPEGAYINDDVFQESKLKVEGAKRKITKKIRKEKYQQSTTIIAELTGVVKSYRDNSKPQNKDWKLVLKNGNDLKPYKGMMLPIINILMNELRVVRVAPTQFSRFSDSFLYSKDFSVSFLQNIIDGKTYNVHIEVNLSKDLKIADVYLNFDGMDFEDFYISYPFDVKDFIEVADELIWAKEPKSILDNVPENIKDLVLKSFRFAKPLNYTTNETYDFIGGEGEYEITLRQFKDRLFFTVF